MSATPGPWRMLRQGDALDGWWDILSVPPNRIGGPQIATVIGALGHDLQSEANARLIAAAPEMRAFIEQVANTTAHSMSVERRFTVQFGEAARALLRKIDGAA